RKHGAVGGQRAFAQGRRDRASPQVGHRAHFEGRDQGTRRHSALAGQGPARPRSAPAFALSRAPSWNAPEGARAPPPRARTPSQARASGRPTEQADPPALSQSARGRKLDEGRARPKQWAVRASLLGRTDARRTSAWAQAMQQSTSSYPGNEHGRAIRLWL